MGFRDTKSGIKSVCYKCEDRRPACHDTCETYLAARKEYDERKETIEKAKDEYYFYETYKYNRIQDTKKKGRNCGKSYNHAIFKQ